jgi:hexosaminidase
MNRMVDAVVEDPPSRQAIEQDVDAVIARGPDAKAAAQALRARFSSWQQAAPHLLALATSSKRFNDESDRSSQLGELGASGLEALGYLETHKTVPPEWKSSKLTLLMEAQKPSGLVKFDFVDAMRTLVDAAAAQK